ncbi:MAG TPA: sugar phosphate isomerase/epimerase [Syntrophales bacterium]|nr:sugar phosphate isomerase/epimerase [Syntrophales bacterium]
MREIIKRVQAHVPFRLLLTEKMETVIKEGINPEIGFDCNDLDIMQKTWVSEVAKRLSDAGLTVTFHAPFMDLRPGAIDPRIRKVTTDRLQQVFDLVPYFHPLTVVCHPSFDEGYYNTDKQAWLENSIETWGHFLKLAEEMGTRIALENVYETEPTPLNELFSAFTSSRLCFCFDTGHFNVFSRVPLDRWVEKLAHRLGQLHIHDNNGQTDEHFPVGEGNFPFLKFFSLLRSRKLSPLVTLEAHSEDSLRQMIQNIKRMDLLGKLSGENPE